jgi:predicted dehydrogenase
MWQRPSTYLCWKLCGRASCPQWILGEIRLLTADHSQYLPNIPRLWEPELGGGALLDLGIYPVSFAVRALGLPKSFCAKATLTGQGVDETTSLIFEYENGAHAALTTCMSATGPVTATVVGTFGRIEIDNAFYNQTSFRVYNQGRELIQSYDEKIESPILSVTESVEIMRLMDSIRAQIGVKYPTE